MKVSPKKIMCAVDFSDFTDEVLAYSVAMCKKFNAKLFLTHIVIDVDTSFVHSGIAIDKLMLQDEHTPNAQIQDAHIQDAQIQDSQIQNVHIQNAQIQEAHIQEAQKSIRDLVKEVTIEHEILISKGDPADEIRRLALKEKIDMVITATHGKSGIKRLLIGSVTEKLMKILYCPLLVLHTQKHNFLPFDDYEMKLKKILVGCDFSPDSKLAFDYGLSLAKEYQAELYLTHVIKSTEHIELKASDYINAIPGDHKFRRPSNYFEMQKKVTEANREEINTLRSRLERQLYFMLPEECRNWCTPHTILLVGEPYKELIKYAQEQEIDMIVLGIRGHTLWEKLMVGSTTDRVIRYSPCPVLAVQQMDEDKNT